VLSASLTYGPVQFPGHTTFHGQLAPVHLKAHLSPERYSEPGEINWFARGEGERTYVFMRPYLTLPSTLPAPHAQRRASPEPELDALFGSPRDTPPRTIEKAIGTASAAYYPAVRGLLVWEFHLSESFRPEEPAIDDTYQMLWLGMEKTLLELLPETRFLVTPRWDPDFAEDPYERFLVAMDYLPHLMHEALFMKSREDALPDPPRQRP
jgi:hypothetical protein